MTSHWRSYVHAHYARHWLYSNGSLTARLRACDTLSVRLLDVRCGPLLHQEAAALGLARRGVGHIRTVALSVAGQPRVLARSVVSRSAMSTWHRVIHLGGRPLGEALWANPRVRRGVMRYAWLDRHDTVYRYFARLVGNLPPRLLARRSCFYLHGQPLLVMEVFLPAIEELLCTQRR